MIDHFRYSLKGAFTDSLFVTRKFILIQYIRELTVPDREFNYLQIFLEKFSMHHIGVGLNDNFLCRWEYAMQEKIGYHNFSVYTALILYTHECYLAVIFISSIECYVN